MIGYLVIYVCCLARVVEVGVWLGVWNPTRAQVGQGEMSLWVIRGRNPQKLHIFNNI